MVSPSPRSVSPMVGAARALGFRTARSFIQYLQEHWNDPALVEKYGAAEVPIEPTFYGVPRQHGGPDRLKWLISSAAAERGVELDLDRWYRQIDLVVRTGSHDAGELAPSGVAAPRPDWIYCYCYVVRSRMFVQDSDAVSSPYTIGFFVIDHSAGMSVPHATTWYYPGGRLEFDPAHKRGSWTSEYVGVSETDLMVVYNFEFNSEISPKWHTYKGLLAGKSKPGLEPIFPPQRAYLGNFYALAAPTGYDGPASGEIYIELYHEGPKEGFKLTSLEARLKEDLRTRALELWERLGVQPDMPDSAR